MNDYILRASSNGLLAFAASMPATCDEASKRHVCSPTAAAAIGRTMIATALYSKTMKSGESVSVRINGGGTIGTIAATADCLGNIRGQAHNPGADIEPLRAGKLNVGALVGNSGNIHVSRYSTAAQDFTGAAELINGEIGDDFANYLLKSEQIASAVGLGVWISPDNRITTAGGFIVMALPDCPEAVLSLLENNVAKMRGVSDVLLAACNRAEGLLDALFDGIEYKITERYPVRFCCNCNRERILSVLDSIAVKDLQQLAEDRVTELVCNFCNEKYILTNQEINSIIAEKLNKH